LPLLDAPEADSPILVTTAGTFLITENGVQTLGGNTTESSATPTSSSATPEAPVEPAPTEATPNVDEAKAARNEVYKFMRWLKKSPTTTFTFDHIPATYGETLNKFVSVQDYEGAQWYAERYLA